MSSSSARSLSSSTTSLLNVDVRPGKVPMLRVDATDDAPRWVAEHHDALRAAVVEHGALLVRGLRLRDVAEIEVVFRRLGSLMTEKEAFAARRRYSPGEAIGADVVQAINEVYEAKTA